jgi:hypothetical protein
LAEESVVAVVVVVAAERMGYECKNKAFPRSHSKD